MGSGKMARKVNLYPGEVPIGFGIAPDIKEVQIRRTQEKKWFQ